MSPDPKNLNDEAVRLSFTKPGLASEYLGAGRFVIIVDDRRPDRFTAALVLAAERVDPRALIRLRRTAGGWPCLALNARRCEELGLAPLDGGGSMPMIDLAAGVETGIDPSDQAKTILAAVDPLTLPGAIVSPGHVKVLQASDPHHGEPGYVEGAVELVRAAGLQPAAVVSEIFDVEGFLAAPDDVAQLGRTHDLPMFSAAAIASQARREVVERVTRVTMPTAFGEFELVGFRSLLDASEHLAMVKGDVDGSDRVLVHVHQRCLAGDVFHSMTCACGVRLEEALAAIEAEGKGIVVYDARASSDLGGVHRSQAPAPDREVVAAILGDLGPASIRLLEPVDGTEPDAHGAAVRS